MQHHAPRIERLGVVHRSALFQNQLQQVADVFIWTKHVRFYNRLADFFDLARIRQMRGIVDQKRFGLAKKRDREMLRRRYYPETKITGETKGRKEAHEEHRQDQHSARGVHRSSQSAMRNSLALTHALTLSRSDSVGAGARARLRGRL